MKVLTIIQPASTGLLTRVTSLLEQHQIDVRDIDGKLAGNQAVISLTLRADASRRAFYLLTDAGYKVIAARYLLVRIEDRPGELARLSRTLNNEDIDIRSIHIVSKEGDISIVALQTDEPERARELLAERVV